MDWYYDQLEQTAPLTQEKLDILKIKHYQSGRPYQIGDIILYGMLENKEKNDLTLITFNLDEINTLYFIKEPRYVSTTLPILTPIS
jgi:hypothetical protein